MAASMSENFSERNTMNLDVHQQEIKYITVLIVSTFYFEWKAGDLITVKIMPARLAKIVARLDSAQQKAGWGVGLAVRRFLCAGKYIAPLIEYERGGPQHQAHGGVTFPGILFMNWRVQGVMNGWLLLFLFKMCCHKAS